MSHTLTPKNYAGTAVANAKGRPDYVITSGSSFPTPPTTAGTQAVGMRLVVSDTGYEYEWRGAFWVLIHRPYDTKEPVGSQFYAAVAATTLASAAIAGARTIIVTSATSFVVGLMVSIGSSELAKRVPFKIVALSGTTITLDRTLDLSYASGLAVALLAHNMNVAATAAAPKIYSVAPPPGSKWLISRIVLGMVHSTAGDMGLFGNLTSLTYGVVLRVVKNGVKTSYTVWRNNGEIALDVYDLRFDTRSSGGGSYGTTAKLNLKDADTNILLDGNTDDELQLVIQDTLTGLTEFQARALGHKVEEEIRLGV
jgi:hypothetical protein